MVDGAPERRASELLDGVRAGRTGDLELLLARTRPELLRAIRGMRASIFAQFEAEDVWQEASVQALHSQRTLRARDLAGFRAWFLGIARHCVAKLHRGQRKRVRPRRGTSLPARQLSLLGAELLEETIESMRSAPAGRGVVLAPLRHEQRTALVLHEVFDTDWATLALVLDRSTESAARAVHHRARTAMIQSPTATLP